MGKKSNAMMNYLQDNERFADLYNGGCFAGRRVVKQEDLEEGSSYSEMDEDTAEVVSALMGVEKKMAKRKDGKETYDMCDAIREMAEEGRNEGRNEVLYSKIQKKLAKGKAVEVIADELEESVESVTRLIAEMALNKSDAVLK